MARAPTETGRTMLSKSFIGAASINMAAIAIAKERRKSPVRAYDATNTAAMQVKLPSSDFPPVRGNRMLPKLFPMRLDRPSPKASA